MTPSHSTSPAVIQAALNASDEHHWLHVADRLLGIALLLLFAPFMALIAVIVAALSGQSPLVAHLRVGRDGEPLWIFKFRTMWGGGGERKWQWLERIASRELMGIKPRQDPRVTSRFARLCRTYSIDELPQLAQVATGQMSLVGPRPLTSFELDRYYGVAQREVLSLKPGLTGLWQVRGRNLLTYRQRARYDVYLARNYSRKLYIFILLRTIRGVVLGRGAW